MIYLDYSATTPVNENVLDTYVKVTKDYIGNPNSLHGLGVKAKKLIDASTNQIASILELNLVKLYKLVVLVNLIIWLLKVFV